MTTTPSNPPPPIQHQPASSHGGEPSTGEGQARSKRKKWPWVLGAVLLLVIIIGLTNSGRDSAGTATPTSAAASPAAVQPPVVPPQEVSAAAIPAPEPTAAEVTPSVSPPTVYQGKGDDVVSITKDSGPAVVQFECAKCSSNTVLKTDGAESLLVNEIGPYKGKRLIDTGSGSDTSTLTINATGAWKVTVSSGLAMATTHTGSNPLSGHGDDVVVMLGTGTKAHITNRGESNFVVQVMPMSGYPDLAVNEIGSYDGTVPLEEPAIIEVTSSGKWTIDPS